MSTVTRDEAKTIAAKAAVELITHNEVLAVGSGSTVEIALKIIADRFRNESDLPKIVAASRQAEQAARNLKIPTTTIEEVDSFDLMIDGADEVAPNLTMIKGGGGAHFREKLLARMSKKLLIMVDYSKLVRRLGETAPLPLEAVPFAVPYLGRTLDKLGLAPTLRNVQRDEGTYPYVTDNGNQIIDCRMTKDPGDEGEFDRMLGALPGVVGTGLFVGMASRVFIGMPDGRVEELLPSTAAKHKAMPSILEEALMERMLRAKQPPFPW